MAANHFRRFAWFVLLFTLGVALWGAYVRASGSGAGCGSHWPLCNGQVLPRDAATETQIELTHRITSGLLGVLILVLAVWARRQPRRIRRLALLTLIFTVIEALVGAALVKLELVGDNASVARAAIMAVHLVNTFLLFAALALTAAGHPEPRGGLSSRPARERWMVRLALLGLVLVGASGAVTALGDTLFPAESFLHGLRQDLDPTANFLIRLRVIHPVLALATAILLWVIAVGQREARPRRWGSVVAVFVLAEVAVGLLNLAFAAPIALQILHLALAYCLWSAMVLLADSLRGTAPAPDITGGGARAT